MGFPDVLMLPSTGKEQPGGLVGGFCEGSKLAPLLGAVSGSPDHVGQTGSESGHPGKRHQDAPDAALYVLHVEEFHKSLLEGKKNNGSVNFGGTQCTDNRPSRFCRY